MRVARLVVLGFAIVGAAPAGSAQAPPPSGGSSYVFVWSGDAARKVSDFLAVIDANPASRAYGHVVASVPAGAVATMPHHTEYEMPADGMLLANGWAANRTFVFDVRHPTAPTLASSFGTVGGYSFPHSFARLPNGHLLGTFQGTHGSYAPPGGLVELDEHGNVIRTASAASPALADTLVWPYSLAIDAAHDRVVVTNSSMPIPAWFHGTPASWRKARADSVVTTQIQIWRLSDLKLLSVVALPSSATGGADRFPAEPRVLADGSMYVNTFSCGLYHLNDITAPRPAVTLVHQFPRSAGTYCAVPAIVGHYWVQTVPALPGLVALDIGDPAHPVEVSRLVLDSAHAMPHWLAADPRGNRVVLTGDDMGYVLIVDVDPRSGALTVDRRFRDERTGTPGVSLDGRRWPHGVVARAFVHGTVFGPR